MIDARQLVQLLSLRNCTVRGSELIASCPFPENHAHGDSNPSWGLNLETGLWCCLGCGEKGNLEQLVERVLGVDRLAAIQLAYGELGLEEAMHLMGGSSGQERREVTPLQRDISSWAQNRHPYWAGRGFVEETVGRWQLGYSPEMNRVTVPIWFRGELVGWTARRVQESDEPKWLHSKGLDRQAIVFGLDETSDGSCIVVEAPLSAIMLWQQGYQNVIATMGCKMSQGQADIIRGRFDSALMFYDPDNAGRDGTMRAIEMLSPFLSVFCVGETRDDPAAMTEEENAKALSAVIPSFAYNLSRMTLGSII